MRAVSPFRLYPIDPIVLKRRLDGIKRVGDPFSQLVVLSLQLREFIEILAIPPPTDKQRDDQDPRKELTQVELPPPSFRLVHLSLHAPIVGRDPLFVATETWASGNADNISSDQSQRLDDQKNGLQ